MYVNAIRKILAPDSAYEHISELSAAADLLGVKLIAHNGAVYFKTSKGSWEKTPIELDDLTVQAVT